jgi:hypothetical protein
VGPEEIRALRGSLSRAAFARQLSVTPLTVARWELPDGNKEARRPRGKILERLQRLVVGEPPAAADIEGPPVVVDPPESRDVERATPVPVAPPSDPLLAKDEQVLAKDEQAVLPLLDRLCTHEWARAEDGLLGLLESRALATPGGRALASLGLALVQLFMRLDVRGARTTWAPIAEDAESGKLPAAVAARAYVLGALIFSARDDRSFDPVRTAGYVARAEALLGEGDDDQRVLLVRARVAAARYADPRSALETYRTYAAVADRARSPLAQLIAVTLRGFAAHGAGDEEAAARYSITTRSMALHLGLSGWYVALLADKAHRIIRGAYLPDAILEVVREARELMTNARLPITESYLVILGAEIEALVRAARLADAEAVACEALDVAAVSGLGSFPLAMALMGLYVHQARVPELAALADRIEADAPPSDQARVHVLCIRAQHALLTNQAERGLQLAEEICNAPPGTVGLPYVIHWAHAELVAARLLLGDVVGAEAALQRSEALLRERPSVWCSAMAMRQHGFLLIRQGRLAEARQKLEATVATFGVVGDVIQTFVARVILARIAVAGGAPDAEAQEARVHEELARHHATIAPELYRFTVGIVAPPSSERLREPSLTERLVVAVERLSVRGLQPDFISRELGSILRAVFPGREVLVDGSSIVAGVDEIGDFGAGGRFGGRFGVRGALDAEHRAALRLLSMVVLRITDEGAPVTEEEVAVDTVLPGFVAAAPATRRLKAEVAQLSRSSATILIDGESGSGKEVVARAVHDLSTRSQRPYVVFNCASIPRELFESQLFGHRRGSFTGATSDSLGVVRAADGGTLFLDEIGELPLEMQPKLLRFLENGEVLPIGEQTARRVDVRVIAATHRDLVAFVREGRFREDLFYRLNVVPLRVPPLRDRKEDVLSLARLFIARLAPEGTEPPHLAADAVAALMAHRWPGNVRELRNLIERAMAYTPIPRVLHARDLRITDGAA